jgi:hypothetical protein
MPKIIQSKAIRGSQLWLQQLVNQRPDLLANVLRPKLRLNRDDIITWLSPLEADGYAEYRDEDFLKVLSVHLGNRLLRSFWPSGGAVWDGLGKTSRGEVILIEAKAHVGELSSQSGAESPSSIKLIQQSLDETKRFFDADPSADWTHGYYQYANRLAHLYLLRHLNGIPAWLVFLYFINADDVAGPKSTEEWRLVINGVHSHLDIKPDKRRHHVIDVFFDVARLVT